MAENRKIRKVFKSKPALEGAGVHHTQPVRANSIKVKMGRGMHGLRSGIF